MEEVKSVFGQYTSKSTFGILCDNETERETGQVSGSLLIIIIASIILGFMAVNNICSDTTDRGKNTRLGLYLLLFLTGGKIGWLYVLVWILKINVCA